jgi:hypothetical protein
MGFLDDLSSALSTAVLDQFGLGENTPSDLDGKVAGDFASLGDFASKIDRSAQRSYVESGTIRNIKPRALEIISQEPDITVLVKKRVFSSLIESYRTDLMDADDKLFLRATKRLFYNKCRAIAAYERLTKIERIVSKNDGVIDNNLFALTYNAIDTLDSNPLTSGLISGETRSVFETIRKVQKFSEPNYLTTWLDDREIPYAADIGEGTGVFELTTVAQMNTTTSVNLGQGNASLVIEDPYKLMVVTNEDIDLAISQATNRFKQNNFFRFSETQLEQSTNDLKLRLNQVRRARNASDIHFYINEETMLFHKVRAVFDRRTRTVPDNRSGTQSLVEDREIIFKFNAGVFGTDLFTIDPDDDSTVYVDPSASEGNDGLKEAGNELSLFRQIIKNIYILMGLRTTTRSEIKEFNKQTNYIRKKMRLHYGNQPIIQPMDVVTIFMSTKTLVDSKITEGLNYTFSGDSLLSKLNETVGSIEAAFDDIKHTFSGGAVGQSDIENEKNAIVGPEFPMWLWSMMRNDFTRQAAGTCIFVGIVDTTTHNYSNAKYTLNVKANDNSHYFKMGQINLQPSVNVYNSALYDPLTPFDVDFDTSSGLIKGERPPLLPENARLLNSGSIKSKLGRNRGSPLNENVYFKSEIERISSGLFNGSFAQATRQKFEDPDGFVYRWKEGIGSLIVFGEPHLNDSDFARERSPNLTKDPFAGQDVMNVLSLLVTGKPYNFNTFMRGALKHGKLNKEDALNEDASVSYFRGLMSDITRQNVTWGNFIPFKKLVINERGYSFLSSGQFDLISKNDKLQGLLEQRAKTFDKLTVLMRGLSNTPQFYNVGAGGQVEASSNVGVTAEVGAVAGDIARLDVEIELLRNDFNNTLEKHSNITNTTGGSAGSIVIFGNDISFDPTITGDSSSLTEDDRSRERSEFRKKLNYLTQRRLWKVKANEDPNLFIVDDAYDKNYDVQAFEQSLIKPQLFRSTYTNVNEQISIVSKLLGLEVFADTQGHIQVRPPQYNRVPSSVFRNMLQERAEKGIKIFPEYLESLFFNKIKGLTEHLSITEDLIRVHAAVLGKITDNQINVMLGHNSKLLTSESSGEFGNIHLSALMIQDSPDLQEDLASKGLSELSSILTSSLNSKVSFDVAERASLVNKSDVFKVNDFNVGERIKKVGERLRAKTQQDPPTLQSMLSTDKRVTSLSGRSQSDILKVTNDIARLIANRQITIKSLANSTKNLTDGLAANDGDSGSAESILLPNLNRDSSKAFPEILEHMIEDETVDDLGAGSGNRYVVKDSQVISLDVTVAAPEHTIVQVDGLLDVGLVQLPPGLELNSGIGSGGNAMASAFAVDYDMWRMFGFRSAQAVKAPYFSNPHTQCAPFAVFLLNLARKKILRGSASLVGSEFYQPGEVYYVEDRDLLFYAESISQSYTYGGTVRTSAVFTYGHNPGEYIPTQLDIIGKALYANRHSANLIRQVRHERPDNSTHIATVIHDTTKYVTGDDGDLESLVGGVYGNQNRKALANAALTLTGVLTKNATNKDVSVEVRIYYNSDTNIGLPISDSLLVVAGGVKRWLRNPSKVSLFGEEDTGILTFEDEVDQEQEVPEDIINIEVVDLNKDKTDETRSPSSSAWSKVRSIISVGISDGSINVNQYGASQDSLSEPEMENVIKRERQALTNCIIDVWAVFSDREETTEDPGDVTSEDDAKKAEKIRKAQEAALQAVLVAAAEQADEDLMG